MAGSPFNKGGAATAAAPKAAAPAAAKDTGIPGPDAVTDIGDSKPISQGDPFSQAADPSGISGMKPIFFMGQMLLMHPTEYGEMKTTANTAEKPKSEFVRFDIIPLTVPSAADSITRTPVVNQGEVFAVMNKDGEIETCDPYAVGERIDDVLVFNAPLVREGKKALENGTAWLRGRIELGVKKQGQSPPVILVALDDDDKELYNQVVVEIKRNQR